MSGAKVLVVEDDDDLRALLSMALQSAGSEVLAVASELEALTLLAAEDVDVVVSDVCMSEMGGIELCTRIHEARPDLPVIFVTGRGSLEVAIDAIRAGAFDLLLKPVDKGVLLTAVERATRGHRLQRDVERGRLAGAPGRGLPMRGSSRAMQRVHDVVTRVAPTEASVLICGETGTGKELVARSIHGLSRRSSGPFVAINCAAVPPGLLESELFGHAKGAFTDARTVRAGLFAQANGGTLFLDEIGEMPMEMQAKLLRALQERRTRAVGADHEVAFDARIIAATNRELESEIARRRFREDLFYRINVVRVDLPPLRGRADDVLELSTFFLEQLAKRQGRAAPPTIGQHAATKLVQYDWPGNVRELENCLERALAMSSADKIEIVDLPEKLRRYRATPLIVAPEANAEVVTLDEIERRYVSHVVKMCSGNKSKAALLLGVDRRTLYRKLAGAGSGLVRPSDDGVQDDSMAIVSTVEVRELG
jgi:two-component system, NtrC family, response regulator HydG